MAPGVKNGRVPGPGTSAAIVVSAGPDLSSDSRGSWSGLLPIVLGALTGMDKQGETILGTYLYGGGVDHEIYDDEWSAYMKAHKNLSLQYLVALKGALDEILAKKTLGRFPLFRRFHAEFPENSGFSGYALLHGSNSQVGDATISGWAEVRESYDPKGGDYDVDLDLFCAFHDIVDPNGNYLMDKIRATMADIFTLGSPRKYKLSIYWSSKCLAEVRQGAVYFYGYPSQRAIPVRPLASGKLDVNALNRKYAKAIEDQIIAQLKRNISTDDVKQLADRKNRLLWLFYRLSASSYMGSTYVARFKDPSPKDELVTLFKSRISTALRAECMAAFNGKKPEGSDPTQ
jgi:hypothetical protein